LRRRDGDSGQNTRAGHVREDQTWSSRHGSEQQVPATCFAAPTPGPPTRQPRWGGLICLRNRCSWTPTLAGRAEALRYRIPNP
jgi:hypothetical protein